MKLKVSEKDLQKSILDYLALIGAVPVKINNVGILKANGQRIPPRQLGIADILACYKGKFVAIEVKSTGKEPTDWQYQFLRQVSEAGGIAFWTDNIDTVIDTFNKIKNYKHSI